LLKFISQTSLLVILICADEETMYFCQLLVPAKTVLYVVTSTEK